MHIIDTPGSMTNTQMLVCFMGLFTAIAFAPTEAMHGQKYGVKNPASRMGAVEDTVREAQAKACITKANALTWSAHKKNNPDTKKAIFADAAARYQEAAKATLDPELKAQVLHKAATSLFFAAQNTQGVPRHDLLQQVAALYAQAAKLALDPTLKKVALNNAGKVLGRAAKEVKSAAMALELFERAATRYQEAANAALDAEQKAKILCKSGDSLVLAAQTRPHHAIRLGFCQQAEVRYQEAVDAALNPAQKAQILLRATYPLLWVAPDCGQALHAQTMLYAKAAQYAKQAVQYAQGAVCENICLEQAARVMKKAGESCYKAFSAQGNLETRMEGLTVAAYYFRQAGSLFQESIANDKTQALAMAATWDIQVAHAQSLLQQSNQADASGAKTEGEMVSTAPQQEALEKAALLRPLVDAWIASGQENQANSQANSQANDGGQEPEEHKKATQSA